MPGFFAAAVVDEYFVLPPVLQNEQVFDGNPGSGDVSDCAATHRLLLSSSNVSPVPMGIKRLFGSAAPLI
jgi:hypothetical protein